MNQRHPGSRRKLWLLAAAGLALCGLVVTGVLLYQRRTHNLAYDVLKPVEVALLEAGATKACDNGDTGRSADNTHPWYQANYRLSVGQEQAKQLVTAAAAEGGFTIRHASREDRGPLPPVADELIDRWFYDASPKQHSLGELEPGQIVFHGSVNASTKACDELQIDETHSVVWLSVSLPDYRR